MRISVVFATFALLLSSFRQQTDPSEDSYGGPISSTLQLQTEKHVPETCPVTKPPEKPFVPPLPYPRQSCANAFWFGTTKLWTLLGSDGRWHGLPVWADGSLRQKLFWWHEGYDWHRNLQPKLSVTGRRLDSPTSQFKMDEPANNGWTDDPKHPFIVTGINLPGPGCWEIKGELDQSKLSFVVWVTK